MEIIKTEIPGLLIIKPQIFDDKRGYFVESYSENRYKEAGITADFIQDNISGSKHGVVRGFHYQLAPYSQAKLIQVLEGTVLDIAIDLRKGSPTFGQHYSIELSADNNIQFYIPQGFGHGFSVLTESATFSYKCDNYYNREAERGINFNDPHLGIDWKILADEMIISPKDSALPLLKEAEMNFIYNT